MSHQWGFFFFSNIKEIVEAFGSHLNIDLQQRGVEFTQLFGAHKHLRESLLEKMPAMTINRINGANGEMMDGEVTRSSSSEKVVLNNGNARSNTDTLLDLLGSGDDIISSTPMTIPTSIPAPAAATSNLLDLLGDIDLSAPTMPVLNNNNNSIITSPVTVSILDDNENTKIPDVSTMFNINGSVGGGAQTNNSNYDLGLDFLSSPTSQNTTTTSAKVITVFDKNDLVITFATSRQGDHVEVVMSTTNNSMDTLEQYLFQVCIIWSLNRFIIKRSFPPPSTLVGCSS
jgi:AP-1 complex subunit gamma-1